MLYAHSSVFILQIFAKCTEAVADTRGRVRLNTIGRVAALVAATMIVAMVLVMTMMIGARDNKRLTSNS